MPEAPRTVAWFHCFSGIAGDMALGSLLDAALAWSTEGPPVVEIRLGYWLGLLYLALFASALAFSLYLPVVRKIGPGKAAYSSVLVPIIAMAFSTALEDYRWTPLAAAGVRSPVTQMMGLTRWDQPPARIGMAREMREVADVPDGERTGEAIRRRLAPYGGVRA